MLRPGAITIEDVESATGLKVTHDSTVRASGTLKSHYSPNATVQLIAEADIAFEIEGAAQGVIGLLALAEVSTPSGLVRLAVPRNTEEYARALYAALREADALKLEAVLAVPPAATGVGVAVIDRLIRAAAGA
jgi:L-threonylcarbamoyladenylate synthase